MFSRWLWVIQVLYDDRTVLMVPSTTAMCAAAMELIHAGHPLLDVDPITRWS